MAAGWVAWCRSQGGKGTEMREGRGDLGEQGSLVWLDPRVCEEMGAQRRQEVGSVWGRFQLPLEASWWAMSRGQIERQ